MENALVPVTPAEAMDILGLTEAQVQAVQHIKNLQKPADQARALLAYPSVHEQMKSLMHRAWGDYGRLEAALISAVAQNPKLLDYPRTGLYMAMIQCAQLGLAPTGQRGGGWLIPRDGQIIFQPSYTGVLQLVRRACAVKDVRRGVVREQDEFSYDPTAENPIRHEIDWKKTEEQRGDRMVAWALIRTENGGAYPGVLLKDDMQRILQHVEKASRGRVSPAWKNWTDEMFMRSALLRATKLAPTKGADMDEDLENMGRVISAETAEPLESDEPAEGWEES